MPPYEFTPFLIRGYSFVPPYSSPKVPFRWGGVLYPILYNSLSTRPTPTYIAKLYMFRGGGGVCGRAGKWPGPHVGQLFLVSSSLNDSQLKCPCTSPVLRPMNIPAGRTGRLQLKHPSNRAYVPNKHVSPRTTVYYKARILGLVSHGAF
jgi:hypothetical protein